MSKESTADMPEQTQVMPANPPVQPEEAAYSHGFDAEDFNSKPRKETLGDKIRSVIANLEAKKESPDYDTHVIEQVVGELNRLIGRVEELD